MLGSRRHSNTEKSLLYFEIHWLFCHTSRSVYFSLRFFERCKCMLFAKYFLTCNFSWIYSPWGKVLKIIGYSQILNLRLSHFVILKNKELKQIYKNRKKYGNFSLRNLVYLIRSKDIKDHFITRHKSRVTTQQNGGDHTI